MRVSQRSICSLAVLCAMCFGAVDKPLLAQANRGQGQLQFNSQTPLPLDTIVRFISDRMQKRFIYSAEIGRRQVNMRTPADVPASALYPLFNSALRTANLAIVDAEVPGWKRIVDAKDLPLFATQRDPAEVMRTDGSAVPVTQSFKLNYINAQQLSSVLKPFLSKVGSNSVALSESNVILISDYAPTVATISRLIKLLDVPTRDMTYDFYVVKNMSSKTLVEKASPLLLNPAEARGGAKRKGPIELLDDSHGNRVVVVANQQLAASALRLLERLDIPLGLRTRVYRVQNLSAERLDKLIKGLLPPQDAERTYQSTLDEDGNLLVVRATDAIHRKVTEIIQELDRPVRDEQSPIQFYKLRNARAAEVLQTLLALQEAYGLGGTPGLGGGLGGLNGYQGFGGQNPFQTGQGFFPNNTGFGGMNRSASVNVRGVNTNQPDSFSQFPPGVENSASTPNQRRANENEVAALPQNLQLGGFGGLQSAAVLPGGARVSADVGTNSLIVVAPAGVQQMYANLIKSLDQRRPQVLIEARIVAVDTSDDFALGVEVSGGDREGAKRLFSFTSFGLSEVDSTSGALTISPSLGFNGTLVDPEVADVVVQALAANSRARVLAVPKILVNDNSTGQLESVVSVPFQSVNASDTVSTTSLGGNQSAGTILNVTPHINEDDNLQLEFEVEFSTFNGAGTDGLPPPRQVDRVGSTVTIPDGQTVIVGGLKRDSETNSFTGVPWLEKVPIIRELTGRTTEGVDTTSFFLFIRPLILRDSRFGDLRFVSNRAKHRAGIVGDYPRSGPVLMK
ncbi:MAG: secretin N-terminal domain-containing protein [Planctomycetaceae bacterium]